jgi:sugar/nucleoside kinase (ribokinase family)
LLQAGKECAEKNKTYCMNLSAPFLIQFFKDQMMSVLPYADIVFGNETEAATYAEVQGLADPKGRVLTNLQNFITPNNISPRKKCPTISVGLKRESTKFEIY